MFWGEQQRICAKFKPIWYNAIAKRVKRSPLASPLGRSADRTFNPVLPIVAKYSQKLMDEQAKQFEIQTQMFTELGVANPRQRSLYFSSTLQGIMLMFSTYPETYPLEAVKAQVIAEFCEED